MMLTSKTFGYGVAAVLILFVVPLVAAAPPSSNPAFSESNIGLDIVSAHPEILKYGTDIEFYFHIYNSSSQFLNNTQASCIIHIYNSSNGHHLEETSLTKHGLTEFEYVLNYSKGFDKEKYTYIVSCNSVGLSPSEYGWLKSDFHLTGSGREIIYEGFLLAALWILLPLIIAQLFLKWSLALGEDHSVLKIMTSVFSVVSVVISYAFSLMTLNYFFDWVEMEQGLGLNLKIYAWILFIIVSYWSIYLIRKSFESAKAAKMERLRY